MMMTITANPTMTNQMKDLLPVFVVRSLNQIDDDTGEPLYWNNCDGWVDYGSATAFAADELTCLNLPIGGAWERAR